MPKRKEITPKQFAAALGIPLTTKIAYEPALFSAAEANGQMIVEASPKAAVTGILESLADQIIGRRPQRKSRGLSFFWNR